MTARQLLSTLRLAQAHAKIHLRDEVNTTDVEEALRLVYMSKASVLSTDDTTNRREDVLSAVFAVIREYFVSTEREQVEVSELETVVARKGFTVMQLQVGMEKRS